MYCAGQTRSSGCPWRAEKQQGRSWDPTLRDILVPRTGENIKMFEQRGKAWTMVEDSSMTAENVEGLGASGAGLGTGPGGWGMGTRGQGDKGPGMEHWSAGWEEDPRRKGVKGRPARAEL